MNFNYPVKETKFQIPRRIIHGTNTKGILDINKHGIRSRGFNIFGKQNPAISLDFGEGFLLFI